MIQDIKLGDFIIATQTFTINSYTINKWDIVKVTYIGNSLFYIQALNNKNYSFNGDYINKNSEDRLFMTIKENRMIKIKSIFDEV